MSQENTPENHHQGLTARLDIDFALKAARLGVWEMEPATSQILWDERCRELYGLKKDNLLTYKEAIRFIHPNDVDRVDEAVKRAMMPEFGGDYDATYRTIGADDGILRWVRFTGQVSFNEHQEVSRFAGVAQDVTKDELARQLTESEERYRTMVENAPVAIGVMRGEQLIIESANSRVLDILHKPASIIGKPWLEALPELKGTPAIDIIRDVYRTGVPFTASEFPAQLEKDGVLHQGYYSFSYLPLLKDGATSGVLQVAIEITDQVVARQKVAESEARFRALIEEAPVATCLFVGRELRIDVANEAMINVWGKGRSVMGKSLADALPELLEQHFLQTIDNVFTTGVAHETKAGRADLVIDGKLTTFYFDYSFKPLRDASGEVYAIMEMAIDVTAQVVAQQRIEESQQRLLASFEAAPVGIAVLDRDKLTFRLVNPAYAKLVDRPGDQLIGKPLLEAIPELKGQGFDLLLENILATGIPYTANELTAQLMVGGTLSTVYFNTTYQPLYEHGSLTDAPISGILAVALDVTEQVLVRRKIEESEQQYRALSAQLDEQVQQRTQELQDTVRDLERSNQNLQQFAYVASHDLQEPLRKIQSFGNLLQAQYTNELGEGEDYLQRMLSAATRMSVLIKDLLTYSRISTQQEITHPVPLSHVVKTILADLELIITETRAIVTTTPLPTIQGDRSQLEQLFQNLLSNALKFRQSGIIPEISVTAAAVVANSLPPTVRPARVASYYYRIDVADNGIGFDEKHLGRIFQVFQRLHGRNEFAGTGIGLAICEKVAANHGGAITATSKPGHGATFSVYLPVMEDLSF